MNRKHRYQKKGKAEISKRTGVSLFHVRSSVGDADSITRTSTCRQSTKKKGAAQKTPGGKPKLMIRKTGKAKSKARAIPNQNGCDGRTPTNMEVTQTMAGQQHVKKERLFWPEKLGRSPYRRDRKKKDRRTKINGRNTPVGWGKGGTRKG